MYSVDNRVEFPKGKSLEDFNKVQKAIFTCLQAQLYGISPIVPFLKGPPAIGKTDFYRQIAEMFTWGYEEVILSRYSAVELQGLFVPNHESRSLEHYPLKRITGGNTTKPTIILFDEITNAEEDVQAAIQSAFQSRVIEGCKVDNNIMFAAAGNGSEDGCNSKDLSRAMLEGRLLTINCYPDTERWINDFAIPNEINPYIVGYIEWQKESLYKFNPDSGEDAQPTCRGWAKLDAAHKAEMVWNNNSYIDLVKNSEIATTLGEGCIGASEYQSYKSFVSLSHKLPSFVSICSTPLEAKLPDGMGEQWAVISNITSELSYMHKKNRELEEFEVENICSYVTRMPDEFIALACHSIGKISDQVRDSSYFTELIKKYTTTNEY